MPPKVKVTKEQIRDTAVELVRREGIGALNARALASLLGCSTQPVFSQYETMEALRADVLAQANAIYQSYLREDMAAGVYPPYKASGMAYIRFAGEEKELFRLLFMRDRTGEEQSPDESWEAICALIQNITGYSRETAERFHLEMWSYVHGIAVMFATSYLSLETETVSAMLTDAFLGFKHVFAERGKKDECN